MAFFLFDSYCYETLDNVGNVQLSKNFFPNGDQIISFVVSGSDLIFTTTGTSVTLTPPSCDYLGHAQSYTGLTIADATELGLAVVVVLISAWAVTIIRKALN